MKITIRERETLLDYAESWRDTLLKLKPQRSNADQGFRNEVALIGEFIAMIDTATITKNDA